MSDLRAKLRITERRGLDLMADFVMVQLQVGNTFYRAAKNYKNEQSSRAAIEKAFKALETAEKYMWKLRMEHSIFDAMTADAERLRLELEALPKPSGG